MKSLNVKQKMYLYDIEIFYAIHPFLVKQNIPTEIITSSCKFFCQILSRLQKKRLLHIVKVFSIITVAVTLTFSLLFPLYSV